MPVSLDNLPDEGVGEEIDLSGLPDERRAGPLELRLEQGQPPSFWDRTKRFLFEDPKKERAKAANALAISESLGISPSDAYKHHDEISREMGLDQMPSTPELLGGIMLLPITAGLMSHPVGTILGLAAFQAIGEAENAIISLVQGEKYQFMAGKGITELLPEQTESTTKELIESLEFAALMLAGVKTFRGAPKLKEKILRQMTNEHKGPRSLFVDPADLKTELQRGNILPVEEMEMVKSLGLTGAEYKQAIKEGIHIEMPAEKIITIKDRVWWGKLKKILKIDPVQESRIIAEGKPTYRMGEGVEKEVPKPAKPAEPLRLEPPPVVKPERIRTEALAEDEYFHIPKEPIRETAITEYSQLAGEASRRAIEKIQKRFEKEDVQIRREAKKQAVQYIEEDPQYRIFREIIADGRINRQTLISEGATSDQIKALNRVRPGIVSNKGGLHADKVAAEYGYDSVDEMLEDWIHRKHKKMMVEELADQLADEEFIGVDAVRDVIFNELVVEEEIKILNKMLKRKPHKMKDIKKIIRKETGQQKASKIIKVEERVALRDQIRFEAKAAREAFRAGKKEAALKHKEKQRELLARKKEKDRLRKHILNLAKFIGAKPPKGINFYYREAIENIQAGIDPKFRGKRTLEQRERARQFLRGQPEKLKDMPVKLIRDLNKKTLNDFTIPELEKIADEIARLKKLGKNKQQLLERQKKKEVDRVANSINASLTKGEPPPPEEPKVKSTQKRFAPSAVYSKARAMTLQPQRMFDLFDGRKGYEGVAFNTFYRDVNKIENKKLRQTDKRIEAGGNELERLKIKVNKLAKKTKIDGTPFTRDEMIDVYNKSKNPLAKLALIHGNKIPEDVQAKIISMLTPEEKDLGDFIVQDFADNYNRLREAHIAFTNTDLGYEMNYSPMIRLERDYHTLQEQIADHLLRKKALRRGATETGFTKQRKKIPIKYQKPIKLGAYEVWAEQVALQEHYIHFADKVRQLNRIAEHEKFREGVGNVLGESYIRATRSYNNHVADPEFYRTYEDWEKGVRILRQNIALAYLSGNLVTVAKQLPSLFLYMPDSGPYWITRAATEFSLNPFKVMRFVNDRDPQVKHRSIERELEELKRINRSFYDRFIRKFGRDGTVGIRMMDRIAVTIGWYSVYLKNLRKFGEAKAVELASEATLRTQPTARAKDLPQIYRSNEALNIPLQFTRQLNQIYNIWTYDLPSDARNKEFVRSFYTIGGLAISALVIWAVVNKRFPESPEDVAEAFRDQGLGMLPVIGKPMQASASGWHAQNTPLWDIGQGVTSVWTKEGERRTDLMLQAWSLLAGFPYIGSKRAWEAAMTEDVWKLLGKPPKKKKRTR